ncbi:MAG: YcaO-related McrA-glycine thioamidation protein [Methanomicrobiales archaeon]|nr:YcaO-related McrA-glycine thioamidation protein [Methanomicrobiales archaeon]
MLSMEHALARVKKHYFSATHRSCQPSATIARLDGVAGGTGISEVTDITSLDRLGIPCFAAVRPRAARGSTGIHSGKGIERDQAEVSALMEAVERFSAEYRGEPMQCASYEEIGITRAVNPEDLILPRPLKMGEKVHWTEGWDFLDNEEVMLPSNAVYHPYTTLGMTEQLFRSDSTGLAAGNTREEAILYALLEVIEWDALSIASRTRCMGKRIAVDQPGTVQDLVDRFASEGIHIHLWLLQGSTGIPTITAAADDQVSRDPAMLVMGAGTHTCPEIAAVNALLEVAQTRATTLFGGNKDTGRAEMVGRIGYDRLKRLNHEWFTDAEEVPLSSVPDFSTGYIDDDVRRIIAEVGQVAERVCVCDLSKTAIPVVRVIVPGFEVSHSDRDRLKKTV